MKTTCLTAGILLSLAMAGCSGGGASFDDDSAFVVTGTLVDDDGKALAGAVVTVDGVQARSLSQSDGTYTVYTDVEPVGQVLVTATKVGMRPTVSRVDVSRDGRVASVDDLVRVDEDLEPDRLVISGPNPDQVVNPDDDCVLGVTVTGYAHRGDIIHNHDIMVVIDASGSTADPATSGGGLSIFDQQLIAAKRLVSRLQKQTCRVGVIRFATDATVVLPPTDNKVVAMHALDQVRQDGPELRGDADAASDFEEAMQLAASVFASQPWEMTDPDDADETVVVSAHKRILFFTDGIPTLPVAPGLTQEAGDIEATIAAAEALATAGIKVHGFAIGPEIETNVLTTLPAVAAITDGSYLPINSQRDVELEMDLVAWVPVESVLISNPATGDSQSVRPGPDGYFTAEIAVTLGEQTITVTTPGDRGASATVTVEGVIPGTNDVPYALLEQPVSVFGFLRPDGTPLEAVDQDNLDDELGDSASQTTAETFVAHSSLGTTTATVSAAFVRKEAGWSCDVGYLVLDGTLDDPSASVEDAFAAATTSNVLFNTADLPDNTTVEPGDADYSFDVPAGAQIAFFIVANGTLAQAQDGDKTVHYTVARFNGGGYTQHIAFYAPDGRRDAGDPVGIMLAFEDMPLVKHSDKDYSDCTLYITGLVSTGTNCAAHLTTGD